MIFFIPATSGPWNKQGERIRAPLYSAAGGAALAVAFLAPDWGPLAWFAFLPVFVLAPRATDRRAAARIGFAMGITVNGILGTWLIETIERFGGFPWPLAVFFYCLLVLYTALPFAALGALLRTAGPRAPLLLAPALWVAIEFLFPGLFPWRLAYSQRAYPLLIQSADLAGPGLLSFVMVWTTAALAQGEWRKLRAPLAALLLLLAYGGWRMGVIEAEIAHAPGLQIGVVQGNLSLDEKHGVGRLTANLARYRELSSDLRPVPDLIVWPETVITWGIEQDRALDPVRDPWPQAPAPLLFGAISWRKGENRMHWFNSVFLRGQDGSLQGRFDKIVLMPFGEFLPFADRFPWLRALSPQTANFDAGTNAAVFPLAGGARIGPAICYEDMLHDPLGASAAGGANILISVANDAWYNQSAALLLHETLGMWRAVENRRFFLRATNTGLTSAIDPLGRRIFELPVGEAVAEVVSVRLLDVDTPFRHVGNSLDWALLLLALVLLGLTTNQNRRANSSTS